jgi:hypothetical protein
MIRPVLRLCALIVPLAFVAACGDSPTEPTPGDTTPPTVQVTDTFNGTLASGGSKFHVFRAMPGLLTVTLESTDQPSNPALGMAFGMWDGLKCTEVLTTLSAIPTTALTGTASVETDVCIRLWDPAPWESGFTLTYRVTATHLAKPSS